MQIKSGYKNQYLWELNMLQLVFALIIYYLSTWILIFVSWVDVPATSPTAVLDISGSIAVPATPATPAAAPEATAFPAPHAAT